MADNRSFSSSFNRWFRAISAIEGNAVPDPDPLSDVIDHAEDLSCVLVEQQAIVTTMTTADVQWKLMMVANIFDFIDGEVVDGTPLQPPANYEQLQALRSPRDGGSIPSSNRFASGSLV